MTQEIHVLARGLMINNGFVLLCRSKNATKHPFYFLPGGHVEQGESPKDALLRELQEEIGPGFSVGEQCADFAYRFDPLPDVKKCHFHEKNIIYHVYHQALQGGDPLLQQEDHIEIVWVPLQDIEHYDIKPELVKTMIQSQG